ncbi:hypothetical protein MTBBW1_970015 [Desulfamplus magnetovallimortis]|uniref:SHS2 domain-containing protein n=1 Tax=Desulfamplus magnetovallimortis TaxID=1246637 RepID=A0A1W1HLC2_9BACT|nr:hypothetical protein [Desulfamplus magnetovallimortis]SLM33235.1 hypothetical protein MTBBW1_970015 [Desulfamplus magnetovallimortis]
MSEKILGIEIGTSIIYGVVIQKTRKGIFILDACHVPYDVKTHELEEALENLLSELDTTGCTASAITISPSMAFFRTLDFPFSSPAKIRQVLDFELASVLPLPSAGYLSDFSIIKAVIPDETGLQYPEMANMVAKNTKHSIFTTSVPTEIVDICFNIVSKRAVQPDMITVSGLPAAHLLTKSYSASSSEDHSTITILILINADEITTVFIYQKNILAIRTFSITKKMPSGKPLKTDSFYNKHLQQTMTALSMRHGITGERANYYVISSAPEKYSPEFNSKILKP